MAKKNITKNQKKLVIEEKETEQEINPQKEREELRVSLMRFYKLRII